MSTLYEIDAAILAVIENGFHMDDETGEFWEECDLEALEHERTEKLEACAVVIKSLEAEAAALKAEEKALAERRQAKERRAASLRDYVARSLIAAEQSKLETTKCALSFRKSESVDVFDLEALPADFLKQPAPVADKTAIKKALKAGESVSGAALVEKQNLQVK